MGGSAVTISSATSVSARGAATEVTRQGSGKTAPRSSCRRKLAVHWRKSRKHKHKLPTNHNQGRVQAVRGYTTSGVVCNGIVGTWKRVLRYYDCWPDCLFSPPVNYSEHITCSRV